MATRAQEAAHNRHKRKHKHMMSKSEAAKMAHSGKDMGQKGKNFEKISEKAAAKYGSKEAGDRVAGAVFQKMRRAGRL